jgi:hypothetical protein
LIATGFNFQNANKNLTQIFIHLRPQKMNSRKNINRAISLFWLGTVMVFLGLQTASSFHAVKVSSTGDSDPNHWVWVQSHGPQVSVSNPNLTIEAGDFFIPSFEAYSIAERTLTASAQVFKIFFKETLIRILRTSICINAP